jgi:hypothetical protein
MAFACSRRSLLIGDYMKTGSAADVKYLDPGIGFLQYGELRVPEYSEGVWSTECPGVLYPHTEYSVE